jgi:hypothetical protein
VLVVLAKPPPVKPVLLLSIVPSTEQKPDWFSCNVMLTPFASEELDSELDDLDDEDRDDREDEEIDEEETDEREDDREELEILDDRLEDTDEGWVPQMLPVTVGVSALPLVFTCTPNAIVCPGCMLPFQLTLLAE